MEIPKLQDCTTVFIAGPVSSGKTFLLKKLINRMERSLTIDISADFLSEDYEHVWSEPVALAERLKQNPYYYRLAYHTSAENYQEDFHWCYAAMWSMQLPRWLVIDEVQEVCGNRGMNGDMENILRYSRKNLLGVIGASQRIADVNRLLTQSARMIILFHTIEPLDLEAVADRLGGEVADAVQNLRPCIYNDASQVVEQEPECLVYMKGKGYKVMQLGDKIKSTTDREEIESWEETSPEAQREHKPASLPPDSGEPERKLPEDSSEPTPQN